MVEHRFTQELGLTHAEFFRSLPAAIEHRDYRNDGAGRVEIPFDGGRRVVIRLGEEQVREIALLRMPYCRVAFEFHGFEDDEREAFMRRFDLYFRRGGG